MTRDLLAKPSDEVAPMLLGWTLSHTAAEGTVTVELTEVEAYAGEADPASHAYRGPTPRNAVMFGRAGRLYVYRSYGLHWCCNVVTGDDGTASAVLLRAGRVLEGVDLARARRGGRAADRSLARGPACLTQALGIDAAHDGADLLDDGALRLSPGPAVPGPAVPGAATRGSDSDAGGAGQVASGPRVGVSRAHDVPWRFWREGDPSVSAYKRSPRAV